MLDFFQKLKEETLSNSVLRIEISICTGSTGTNGSLFDVYLQMIFPPTFFRAKDTTK